MSANTNTTRRWFLLFCAAGLIPVAMGYGALPARTMPMLLGVEVDSLELTHILRAVMGLYLGMVVLWVLGALRAAFTPSALIAGGIFMLGLAAGRLVSLFVDGVPHHLLVIYLGPEISLGVMALASLNNLKQP